MIENNRENLSACMDGRLAEDELRFMLRRLQRSPALLHDWSRYHLIRDSLRGEVSMIANMDFSARVMSAVDVDAESSRALVTAPQRWRWLRWSAGGAIAASVAIAALIVSQPSGPGAISAMADRRLTSSHVLVNGTTGIMSTSVPAVAPRWLSNFGAASALSEPASFGTAPRDDMPFNAPTLAPYQLHYYRAVPDSDGRYLLLIDPAESAHSERAVTGFRR